MTPILIITENFVRNSDHDVSSRRNGCFALPTTSRRVLGLDGTQADRAREMVLQTREILESRHLLPTDGALGQGVIEDDEIYKNAGG